MSIKRLSIFTACMILVGCNAESATNKWQQKAPGAYGRYQATLECGTPPETGAFQDCRITFETINGDAANLQLAQVEGGMPAHGHGLPTMPLLRLQTKGDYRIDGLKYNMPGAWLLGFKIHGELGQDQIVFDFVI